MCEVTQGGGCVCSVGGGLATCPTCFLEKVLQVSSLGDCGRFFSMLVKNGEVDGVRLLSPESVQLLRRDWLNDFSAEKRRPQQISADLNLTVGGCRAS